MCVQALIICGWKDRDGIEGFIMLHKEGGGRKGRRERWIEVKGGRETAGGEGETAGEKEADGAGRE